METYSALRQFADSWGLVFLTAAFVAIVVYTFRRGSRDLHRDCADIPFRNDDAPGDAKSRFRRNANRTEKNLEDERESG
ncbi:MAG: cbb3-type cytochrome c oxidase subunit 3 [Albidovulum sp.]|nr:cbb3-type cytochrome c oxidase subunit 3 [Albidovulum sp.]MDE0531590.1 cbb3-type cytochrome c oxidase subunit 3 [Albidovulum sp.]